MLTQTNLFDWSDTGPTAPIRSDTPGLYVGIVGTPAGFAATTSAMEVVFVNAAGAATPTSTDVVSVNPGAGIASVFDFAAVASSDQRMVHLVSSGVLEASADFSADVFSIAGNDSAILVAQDATGGATIERLQPMDGSPPSLMRLAAAREAGVAPNAKQMAVADMGGSTWFAWVDGTSGIEHVHIESDGGGDFDIEPPDLVEDWASAIALGDGYLVIASQNSGRLDFSTCDASPIPASLAATRMACA